MEFVYLLICMLSVLVQHSTCSINICLRWTTRKGILKIICKIDDLILPVSIQNNLGVEIARCSIPFPDSFCTPRYKNTTILQNLSTNETIVKVRGRIDQRINGNWSCRHGFWRNKYEANIEINIQTLKEQNKSEGTDELSCLKEISFYTMTGVIISGLTFSICLIIGKYIEREGRHFKRIVSFSETIDKCFETEMCKKHSVKHIKIIFSICLALLVLLAGVLIGVFEKDSCTGSFVFLILGISLSLTLIILFLRKKGSRGADDVSGGEGLAVVSQEGLVVADKETRFLPEVNEYTPLDET